MRRLMAGIIIITALFFLLGLAVSHEWEAPPVSERPLQVVFTSRFPDGSANAYVRIVNIDGADRRILNVNLSYVCSLNGDYFAFLDGGLWEVVKSDGSDPRHIRFDVDPDRLIGVVLTNDGRLMALNQNGNRQQITIAQTGDNQRRYRVQLPVAASSFALSPDGARMVFVADDPSGGVYIANLDGSHPAKVFGGFGIYADWSPSADAIFSLAADHFLYVADAATHQAVRVTSALGYGAAWSPDGNRLVFVRDGDLFIVELNSFHERRLTFDGSSSNMWPCFLTDRPMSLVG